MNGDPFTLDQVKGDVALVYFGYTTCPDVCPTTLTDLQAVKDDLGADADRVKIVMVTIDPERDTQAKLKEYLAFFDPEFIGLRGDAAQTEQFKKDYGITVERVEYPGVGDEVPAESLGAGLPHRSGGAAAADLSLRHRSGADRAGRGTRTQHLITPTNRAQANAERTNDHVSHR